MNKILLDPMCFDDRIPFAITNRGELLPCCYCDNVKTLKTPIFKKLTAVSNIEDHDSLEEILLKDEWREFVEMLEKNQEPPPICIETCGRSPDSESPVRKDTHINTKDKTTIKVRKAGSK